MYQVKRIDYSAIIPRYELRNIDEDRLSIPFTWEHNLRNWTIQDAKDGDILARNDEIIKVNYPFIFHNLNEESNPTSYCGVNSLGRFQVNDENVGYWCSVNLVKPSTKEQRDLLLKKMKEEGYEWNAEKKELRKIERNYEECNEGNCETDGLYYAKTILEKTLGKVEGYQTDDGIIEHKSAINAVKKLCEQNHIDKV